MLALALGVVQPQAQAPAPTAIPVPDAEFIVSDIRVEGLQRISAGTVFASIPVAVGDVVNTGVLRQSIRALFATGNFEDITMGRDGNVLVIVVEERPSISEITIEGNEAIETDALLEGLKGAGLAEGEVFRRSTLEGMQLELQRQYVQQGRYDATIDADIIPEPRNRVSIAIEVNEGSVASIKHINILGNIDYDDETLEDLFELKSTHWLSWFRGDDKYSREKLSGDLETLTSFYLDRGYLKFRIDSTQVSVSPEKDAVYITANINEGGIYRVSGVDLSGDLVLPEADLKRFLAVATGQIYSQALVTSTEEFLTKRLGNEGYNFAEVSGIPEINEEDNTVEMKFFIDPGKRTYVRRINFHGNTRTIDEVLRREMRQMEGAPASAQAIEVSRVRLERLGFFSQAQVETVEVPGHDDLIDVEFEVEEQSSGSISASFGYAQTSGLLVGLNLQQDNFLGSGKRIVVGVNSSNYQDFYNISYSNPYYTEDGVSRGFSLFYRATDLSEINVARYSTDTVGGTLNYGYPISETQRFAVSLSTSNTEVTVGPFAVKEIRSSPRSLIDSQGRPLSHWFVPAMNPDPDSDSDETMLVPLPPDALVPSEPGFVDLNGNEYLNWSITGSWIQSSLNRGRFATRGASNALSLEVSAPGSDLEFFKLIYRGEYYYPITNRWVLKVRGELGFGDGYGDTTELPFYEHFFAGGFGSVRGYETSTLGPRSTPSETYRTQAIPADADQPEDGTQLAYVQGTDGRPVAVASDADPDPFGGDVLIEGGIELIFPLPFIKDQRQIRPALFLDAGNVFSTNCRTTQRQCHSVDLGEIRYSAGIGLSWVTGLGPLTFSLAKPLNEGPYDEHETFQFTIGRGF